MKLIDIPRYSIVMTIGPSNSGKSYLCQNILAKTLDSFGVRNKYLSTDALRRELLGKADAHRHDRDMQHMSKQAHEILYSQLDNYTQYPVNTEVVVVDATHLSRISRAKIHEIAKKNNYQVIGLLFAYKEISDYMKYTDDKLNKKVVYDMVKKLRLNTVKEIDKNEFSRLYKIESIDFSDLQFTYSHDNMGVKVEHDNVCIVGDLHGCYDEFIQLLNDKKGMKVDGETMEIEVEQAAVEANSYVHHVLIGDIVDKGPAEGVRKLIEFLTKNRKHFTIVEGNHDRWNYMYLKGQIAKDPAALDLINSYFDSVKMFEADEELRKKFFKLYESMKTYAYHEKFVATHAPCKVKHLFKEDKASLKAMNTCRYPKKQDYDTETAYLDAREKYFQFLIDEGEINQPAHVFGHVAMRTPFQNKNKYGIDTGCVSGNYMTGLTFVKDNQRPFLRKYSSRQPKKEELITLFRVKANDIDMASLEPALQTRLKWCAKNQVNFVSGTMSPCDKRDGDLESLRAGIEYYRSKGVNRIMLQPKFMGSRCNLLLHVADVTKCRAFSRNAYEIKQERLHTEGKLEDIFKGLQSKYQSYMIANNLEYMLFDGELLPWNAMGKDLIERDFMLSYKACSREFDLLNSTGFEEHLAAFDAKYFGADETGMKAHEKSMKKAYEEFKEDILHTDTAEEALNNYKYQLDIFNATTPLEFSPFSILKTVRVDGSEENWISTTRTNTEIYDGILKKDVWLLIDWEIDPEGLATVSLSRDSNLTLLRWEEAVMTFWKYVTEQNEMEGVVIKPDQVYIPGVAPYMKCRNKEYLRMTYGFDYDVLPVKRDRLYEGKSIRRKLETSIKEWELGRNLLDVPLKDISVENKKWLNFTVQLLSEQDREKELDPRL